MTVAPSPAREVVSDSDDEEKVKRLLLFPNRGEPRNETMLVISWKQHCGHDSGCRYASFVSRLPIACSSSGTVLQAMRSWARALEQGYRCAASDTSFMLLTEAWHYFFVAVSS